MLLLTGESGVGPRRGRQRHPKSRVLSVAPHALAWEEPTDMPDQPGRTDRFGMDNRCPRDPLPTAVASESM
jgi:hypothetical protein